MRCPIFVITVFLVVSSFAADLRSDLREFAAVIPQRRISFIAARHFVLDKQFRRAFNYTRDPDFMVTWQQVRETPEFRSILAYIRDSGAAFDVTSIINNIPLRLRAFRMPTQLPPHLMFARNLNSFLKEVVRSLPRAQIASLMARKLHEGGEFAQLYKALRRDEFRQLIHQARHSHNLAAPIEKLSQHSINVDDLIDMGFSILKWGP